jgi:hypothetical protein
MVNFMHSEQHRSSLNSSVEVLRCGGLVQKVGSCCVSFLILYCFCTSGSFFGGHAHHICLILQFPAALSECCPKEGIELYLHAIEQRPVYPQPDASNNRKLVFYDLLCRSEGFAILSAKKMPKVSGDMTAFI